MTSRSFPLRPETWRPRDAGVPYFEGAKCGACLEPLTLYGEVGYVEREGFILVAHWSCMRATIGSATERGREG